MCLLPLLFCAHLASGLQVELPPYTSERIMRERLTTVVDMLDWGMSGDDELQAQQQNLLFGRAPSASAAAGSGSGSGSAGSAGSSSPAAAPAASPAPSSVPPSANRESGLLDQARALAGVLQQPAPHAAAAPAVPAPPADGDDSDEGGVLDDILNGEFSNLD
jgi:hypothetical protein